MMTKEEMPACPVATTVQLIGSKWKLLILRNLMMRAWRFNEMRRDLEGGQPEGADRLAAGAGRGRDYHPHRLPRGSAAGGICPFAAGGIDAADP